MTPITKRSKGSSHYKKHKIEVIDFIVENEIPFMEGNVLKYVVRHQDKNGAEDIKKAIHYLEMILEYHYPVAGEIKKDKEQWAL